VLLADLFFFQMMQDIQYKGFLCVSGQQAISQDPASIVASYHAVVSLFGEYFLEIVTSASQID
jgi:hypothetical protein